MCAIFQKSGKCPISNKLLKSLDIEKEIGVEIILKYFPGIPQCDKWDFFKFRIIFANSKGLVFNKFSVDTPSLRSRVGAGSFGFGTEDFEEKNVLNILLFSSGSFITISFSTRGGVLQNLLFFISLIRIPNFFFADKDGLLSVALTVFAKAI